MTKTELLKKIREDFKKIADQAHESAKTDDIDQAWADADLILGLAKGLLRRLNEEKARRKWK